MVSPTSGSFNGEIQDNAQSTHQPGKTVKHEKEHATSIALKRMGDQTGPRAWPAPSQGRYHHCGHFEVTGWQPRSVRGLIRRGLAESIGS